MLEDDPRGASTIRVASGFSCNNACIFCAQGRLRLTEVLPGAFAEIPPGDLAGRVVAFVGGEPTLGDALLVRLAEAAQRGAKRIVVQTNGRRLAYPRYVAALAEAAGGRLWLEVSLQGSTKEMHDFHTAVPGSFAQTVAGLRNARAAAIPTGLSTVLTRSSYRHVAELVRLAHAVGCGAVRAELSVPLGAGRRGGASAGPPLALLSPHLALAGRTAERLGIVWLPPGAPPDVRFPFAGLGVTEPAPAEVASALLPRDDEAS